MLAFIVAVSVAYIATRSVMQLRSGHKLPAVNPFSARSAREEEELVGLLNGPVEGFFPRREILPEKAAHLDVQLSCALERFRDCPDALYSLLKECCGDPFGDLLNVRWLSAGKSAKYCRAFHRLGMTHHCQLVCAFVWDGWNVKSYTHSPPCSCYLGNLDEVPAAPPRSALAHLVDLGARRGFHWIFTKQVLGTQ